LSTALDRLPLLLLSHSLSRDQRVGFFLPEPIHVLFSRAMDDRAKTASITPSQATALRSIL